jgi:hypothetical protein
VGGYRGGNIDGEEVITLGLRMKLEMTLEADSQEHLKVMRDKCFEDIKRGVKSSEGYWVWKPGYSKYEVEIEDMHD